MLNFIKPNSILAKCIYFGWAFIILIFIPGIFALFSLVTPDVIVWGIETNWDMAFAIIWIGIFWPLSFSHRDKNGDRKISSVPTDHVGMILFKGQCCFEVGPGLVLLSPGFELKTDPITENNRLIVIQKIETADPREVKYEILEVKREDYEDSDLNMRMTIGAQLNFFYQIKRGHYAEYLTNVGNETKLLELVPDKARAVLAHEFTKRTPAIINRQRIEICANMAQAIQAEIDSNTDTKSAWGVFVKFRLADLVFPNVVVDMITEKVLAKMRKYLQILQAEIDSKVVKIGAQAEEYRLLRVKWGEAEGERFLLEARAVGRRLMLEAEAIGYGKIARALKMKEADLILRLEAMKITFQNTEKMMFMPNELANIFSFIPALSAGIAEAKKM